MLTICAPNNHACNLAALVRDAFDFMPPFAGGLIVAAILAAVFTTATNYFR